MDRSFRAREGALVSGEPAKQIAAKLFDLPLGECAVRHLILEKELLSEPYSPRLFLSHAGTFQLTV